MLDRTENKLMLKDDDLYYHAKNCQVYTHIVKEKRLNSQFPVTGHYKKFHLYISRKNCWALPGI